MKNKIKFKNNLILIPSYIKEIKNNELVFDPNTEKEQRFIYEGTKEDWAKVEKGQSVLEIPCIECKDGLLIQRM